MRVLPGLLAFLLLLTLLPALAWPVSARADEGWVIESFQAQIDIQPDGTLRIVETISVDFGTLQRHGIYRDIPVLFRYDEERDRRYDLRVESVTDERGRRHQYEVSRSGAYMRIRIGDPDRYVSGRQTYRITYRVRQALNGFDDHDELFWNIVGPPGWPVSIRSLKATVTLPRDGVQRVTCFQGPAGSQEPCNASSTTRTASFEATRTLPEQQYFTIVVAFTKGIVPEPRPDLVARPRPFTRYFDLTPVTIGGSFMVFAVVIGMLVWSWWTFGRDRRYTTLYYLSDNPSEETRPLLASDPIVVEFTPPENMRAAQVGVLLDERADTLDCTATIVDLAVRGYLKISELAADGIIERLFSKKDWLLTRTDKDDRDLLPYERILLQGLFEKGSSVKLSELKSEFYTHLHKAQKSLYRDVVQRGWFPHRPDRVRLLWAVLGLLVAALGMFVSFGLGARYGAALVGVPVVLGGLLLTILSPWMPRRNALGREMLRRALGFRQYIATAEKDRQKFNEQQNLFSEYLPYAIVFRCVDKWARAFEGIDTVAATSSWYTGHDSFTSSEFSRRLSGFASNVSSVIASTPGSSGSSGFSAGGGSGGGGGGGGGGSW
jgi:uncharacterized membrane protein